MPQWLLILSSTSIALGILTAGAITIDVMVHPQRMRIMNIVWPVTGLYFPLAGWWLYRALGRPLAADAPEPRERPYWKSVFLSATHCGSGCVIGDLIGAPIVFAAGWALFGERLYADYVVEFGFAYLFGVAFQYFPIRAMRRIRPRDAIVDAVKADTLSLTAFEIGMFLWMALVYFALLAAHRPMRQAPFSGSSCKSAWCSVFSPPTRPTGSSSAGVSSAACEALDLLVGGRPMLARFAAADGRFECTESDRF